MAMELTIKDVISSFNTTPFLFVGSGISRRYLDLPNWRGLLEYFANIIDSDPFTYSSYESKAKAEGYSSELYPKVAELIQRDYDAKWFSDKSIRTVNDEFLELIKEGLSPFKAEIASFISREAKINANYQEEIDKLSEISEKSIAGVITTNYDTFLEDTFSGFKKYVGQSELVFSSIQGLAEIYKIHGSIELPASIVINAADYQDFENKSAYLAAKLMTIFMEYPIVFLGYSISDPNIVGILKSIASCLDKKQLQTLSDRFVFVQRDSSCSTPKVEPYTIQLDGKEVSMKRIFLNDFLPLYEAIGTKRSTIPVRILRKFKKELYDFTISNNPTSNLLLASIDDERIGDDELVLSIGKMSQMGVQGLKGMSANDWYKDILFDTISFSADDLLEHAFPSLIKQNSFCLPIHKYVSRATKSFPECENYAKSMTFDNIISPSIKSGRACLKHYSGVKQIWDAEKDNLERATRLMSHLAEEQIELSELEDVLKEIFEKDSNVLDNVEGNIRTNIKRLIRIYDYLKWGK